jgi:hypothetical protein
VISKHRHVLIPGRTAESSNAGPFVCSGPSSFKYLISQSRIRLSEDDWREFVGLVGQLDPERLAFVLGYMRLHAAEVKLTA